MAVFKFKLKLFKIEWNLKVHSPATLAIGHMLSSQVRMLAHILDSKA